MGTEKVAKIRHFTQIRQNFGKNKNSKLEIGRFLLKRITGDVIRFLPWLPSPRESAILAGKWTVIPRLHPRLDYGKVDSYPSIASTPIGCSYFIAILVL